MATTDEIMRLWRRSETMRVPRWALERAVRSMGRLEGLALIRTAEAADGSLEEARAIWAAIVGRARVAREQAEAGGAESQAGLFIVPGKPR